MMEREVDWGGKWPGAQVGLIQYPVAVDGVGIDVLKVERFVV